MVDSLQLLTGINIPVEKLGVTIIQPKMEDIAVLGEEKYFLGLALFLANKKTLKIKEGVDDWEILQELLKAPVQDIKDTRIFLTNFLQLFFVEKVMIGPRSVLIQKADGLIHIEPNQLPLLKTIVSLVGGGDLINKDDEEEFKPANSKAAEIAAKIKKGREKIAAMNQTSSKNGFLATYIKALTIVSSNSLEELKRMTIYQINTLMKTYLAYERYDIEVKSRLAGSGSEDKMVHWTSANDDK